MTNTKNFYVVGIGASAGGLEAIEAFFTMVPPKSGLAFVIIQHLSPDYKSLMPEILLKRTSLPVHTAEDGMRVEPNNVYLIPRKMNMKIFHSKLHLTEKNNHHVLNLPIDIFLHSLAEDFEDKAIGIILSGTGSDGSRGIRAIKEYGGLVIAQNPDSAKFDGMPKSAITSGMVDYILHPQDMSEKMISYVKHPIIQNKEKNKDLFEESDDNLTKIILILKENSGLDFTFYKSSTIARRVERRLSINQIDNLNDYIDYLLSSKNEQKILYKELLIGVTKFFRDSEAFYEIENKIIPGIFEGKVDNEEVRLWVSACSTGEEAYSMAILIKEYMQKHGRNNEVKVFATDVDKSSIDYASTGTYNASITADVSPERLAKFFTQVGDSYKVNADIREMIVFATHNIIKDPPFNKIDLLSCRNLLIYLQPILQQKVLSLFNFALNKNGCMFLGSSESIGEMEHFFESVDIKWKIFRSKQNGKLPMDLLSPKIPVNIIKYNLQPRKHISHKISGIDMMGLFSEKLLEDNTPDTVIVNENCEIVNTFGDPNKYLSLPKSRKLTTGYEFVVSNMVPSNLKLTFNIAINKVIKTQKEVIHYNVKFSKSAKEFQIIDLKFIPFSPKEVNAQFVVIYFIPKSDTIPLSNEIKSFEDIDQQAQQRIFDLENELKHTKENLQSSIEELETTNEELQSTNEELISANEELQSTNEELQSVNEELYTVNTEFQAKNHDLVVMNNDMENLLQNSEIRIIFLDLNLRIRKFTDNITDIFNLRKSDNGRPISDITHNIPGVDVQQKVREVLKKNVSIQQIINTKGRWYEMKMLPYLTQKGFIDGVVISFIDISDLYFSKEDQKLTEQKLKTLFDFMPMGITIADKEGKIISSNKTAVDLLGLNEKEQQRRKIDGKEWKIIRRDGSIMPTDEYASVRAIKENRLIENVEMGIKKDDGSITWILVNATPTKIDGFDIAISYLNITDYMNNELMLNETTNLYKSIFENMESGFALHEIITNKKGEAIDYRFIEANKQFEKITKLKRREIIGKTVLEIIPDIESKWIKTYGEVALTGKKKSFTLYADSLKKTFRVNAFSPKHGQFVTLFEEVENLKR